MSASCYLCLNASESSHRGKFQGIQGRQWFKKTRHESQSLCVPIQMEQKKGDLFFIGQLSKTSRFWEKEKVKTMDYTIDGTRKLGCLLYSFINGFITVDSNMKKQQRQIFIFWIMPLHMQLIMH